MQATLQIAMQKRDRLVRVYESTPEKRMDAARALNRKIRSLDRQIASLQCGTMSNGSAANSFHAMRTAACALVSIAAAGIVMGVPI